MYTEKHIIPLLQKACPDWPMELKDAGIGTDQPNETTTLFLKIAQLARYIGQTGREDRFDDFPKIFNTIELILRNGNDKAKELIVAGLLEVLQNFSIQESVDPILYKKWFKEETLKPWNDIERFWSRGRR